MTIKDNLVYSIDKRSVKSNKIQCSRPEVTIRATVSNPYIDQPSYATFQKIPDLTLHWQQKTARIITLIPLN